MRHNKKFNHLGRKSAHRKAMLSNMAGSLIIHKRINTTVAKAKALQRYVEPILTKAKDDTTNSRRVVFSYLKDKHAVASLFGEVSRKIGDRPGGYTRIIKTGFRAGDGADMAIIELVDFNEIYSNAKTAKKSRRSRRGKKSVEGTAPVEVEEKIENVEAIAETSQEDITQESPAESPESVALTPEDENSSEPTNNDEENTEDKKED